MIANFFLFFSKLMCNLIFKKPKLVYYPVTPTQIGWLGRDVLTIILSKLFRAKVIIHLRGSHFKLNFKNFKNASKKIIGFALRRTDVAIVQANYLKNEFEPYISTTNTKVLYQSIVVDEFENSDLENFEKAKILVVGHLTKAKGYTDIVKIIPQIAEEFPEVQFCFAGNIRKGERGVFFNQVTGEKIEYEDPFVIEDEILNSKYKSNYRNLGLIQDEMKYEHFRNCDIFLSASYSEGFSRSLLEAMTMGKPLVYTPVGAHREVLTDGENGICISPGDQEGIVLAIRKLLRVNKLRNKMAINNFYKARNEFSIEKIAFDFKKIILNELGNERNN